MSKETSGTLAIKWRQTALSHIEREEPEGRQELALFLQSNVAEANNISAETTHHFRTCHCVHCNSSQLH